MPDLPEILCVVVSGAWPNGLAAVADDLGVVPHVVSVAGDLAVITGPRSRVVELRSARGAAVASVVISAPPAGDVSP